MGPLALYINKYEQFKSKRKKENLIETLTGCQSKCQMTRYKTKMQSSLVPHMLAILSQNL